MSRKEIVLLNNLGLATGNKMHEIKLQTDLLLQQW